jgi:hypothetical protein
MSQLGKSMAGDAAAEPGAGNESEAAGWQAATRGTIKRWFAEMEGLFARIRPEMLWNYDELMAAASRGTGKAVVTGDEELFSPQHGKTPHVTLGACFNCQGTAPPAWVVNMDFCNI